jgi:hypothetical protein
MNPALRPLFVLLLLLAAVIWVASIVWAGADANVLPFDLPEFPALLAGASVGIGTALATWLGAAFGIRARENLSLSAMTIPNPAGTEAARVGEWEWAQVAGAWLYVLGLLGAAIMWLAAGTPEEPALLGDSAASIVGLIVGVVGVVTSAQS